MSPQTTIEELARTKTQQSVYRNVLSAFSYPGVVIELSPPADALSLVLATLVDAGVSLADLDQSVSPALWPFLACPSANFEEADFVVSSGAEFDLHNRSPRLGDLYSPHCGATVILGCSELDGGTHRGGNWLSLSVTGPGVESCNEFSVAGMCVEWLEARAVWVGKFPMGVDMLLCAANRIVGIPRTSCVNLDRTAS